MFIFLMLSLRLSNEVGYNYDAATKGSRLNLLVQAVTKGSRLNVEVYSALSTDKIKGSCLGFL